MELQNLMDILNFIAGVSLLVWTVVFCWLIVSLFSK
jgi:hypothetical protein